MNTFAEVDTLLFDMDGTLTDLRKRWWDPFFRAFYHVRPDNEKGEEVFANSIGDIIKHSGGKTRFLIPRVVWKVTRAMGLNLIETIIHHFHRLVSAVILNHGWLSIQNVPCFWVPFISEFSHFSFNSLLPRENLCHCSLRG